MRQGIGATASHFQFGALYRFRPRHQLLHQPLQLSRRGTPRDHLMIANARPFTRCSHNGPRPSVAAPTNPCPTMFVLCSNHVMNNDSHNPTRPTFADATVDTPDLSGTILDFTPVALERHRSNGWSAKVQRRFIYALSVIGSVGPACRAVGMGRVSAYRLRARALAAGGGAESFATAWDLAIHEGKMRQYGYIMERALNGVTTVRISRGGSVLVEGGPYMNLARAALRDEPVSRGPD